MMAGVTGSAFAKESVNKQTESANSVAKSTANLVSAANQYKASVKDLLPTYESAVKTAAEKLETWKELYAKGLISRRDLETCEQEVKDAQARLEQARKQLTESDQLIARAKAEEKISVPARAGGYKAATAVMRSGGSGGWTLANAAAVQSFFAGKFGRPLPVSAYGQSATHNRMGLDHRNAMDVALHPDSAEGQALIAYLRANGIPFIAFRSAVPGAATGPHIHIGHPSRGL